MKLNRTDAERLVTSIFALEQELSRGKWDTQKGLSELIYFAQTFEEKVDALVSGDEQ